MLDLLSLSLLDMVFCWIFQVSLHLLKENTGRQFSILVTNTVYLHTPSQSVYAPYMLVINCSIGLNPICLLCLQITKKK